MIVLTNQRVSSNLINKIFCCLEMSFFGTRSVPYFAILRSVPSSSSSAPSYRIIAISKVCKSLLLLFAHFKYELLNIQIINLAVTFIRFIFVLQIWPLEVHPPQNLKNHPRWSRELRIWKFRRLPICYRVRPKNIEQTPRLLMIDL